MILTSSIPTTLRTAAGLWLARRNEFVSLLTGCQVTNRFFEENSRRGANFPPRGLAGSAPLPIFAVLNNIGEADESRRTSAERAFLCPAVPATYMSSVPRGRLMAPQPLRKVLSRGSRNSFSIPARIKCLTMIRTSSLTQSLRTAAALWLARRNETVSLLTGCQVTNRFFEENSRRGANFPPRGLAGSAPLPIFAVHYIQHRRMNPAEHQPSGLFHALPHRLHTYEFRPSRCVNAPAACVERCNAEGRGTLFHSRAKKCITMIQQSSLTQSLRTAAALWLARRNEFVSLLTGCPVTNQSLALAVAASALMAAAIVLCTDGVGEYGWAAFTASTALHMARPIAREIMRGLDEQEGGAR